MSGNAETPPPTAALRVLVTGASGFVGGALVERLAGDPAFEVLGIGRRALARADYRMLDLAAPDATERLSRTGFKPDVIVHAAARSSPWGSRAQFERDNVQATRAVVAAAAAQAKPPRIVFVSTASVLYAARDQLDVPGDAAAGPRFVNGYAASKHAAETVVRGYPGEWVVLRPRAVFGPGDTTVLPRIVTAARRGALPRFRDGTGGPALSDLLYIDTFVDQLVAAIRLPAAVGRTVVLTGGDPVPLQRTVFELLDRLGVPRPTRTVSRRTALAAATLTEWAWRLARRGGEPPITRYSVIVYAFSKTFDARLCRELFGPAVPPLDEALARTADALLGEGRLDAAGGAR